MTPEQTEEDQKLKLYVAEIVNNRDHKRRGDLIAFSEYLVSWLQDTFDAAEVLAGKLAEGDAPKSVKDDLEVLRKVSEGALGLFVDALRHRHAQNEEQINLVDVLLEDVKAKEQTLFVLRVRGGQHDGRYRCYIRTQGASFVADPNIADKYTSRSLIELFRMHSAQMLNHFEIVPLRDVSGELYANDALMVTLRRLVDTNTKASLHDVLCSIKAAFWP